MADMGIKARNVTPQFISNFEVCENHNLKPREIIPGVVDNEMIRCQSAWTRSVSC